MLVLTRKAGQSLTIGNNITVQVAEIRGNQVKLAIEAPRDVEIMRPDAKKKLKEERNA